MENKIQLNFSCRVNPTTQQVIERSTLVNVRCDSVAEATMLYQQLKASLGNDVVVSHHQELPQVKTLAPVVLPPTRTQSNEGICPQCKQAPLVRRTCQKPGKFFGQDFVRCSNRYHCPYFKGL
jgi:hypothetical protein